MPEVPTVAELAIPGYEIDVWFALYAPAKMPPAIVGRLNAEVRKYLSSAEAKEAYARIGHEAGALGARGRARKGDRGAETFAPIIKAAKLRPE